MSLAVAQVLGVKICVLTGEFWAKTDPMHIVKWSAQSISALESAGADAVETGTGDNVAAAAEVPIEAVPEELGELVDPEGDIEQLALGGDPEPAYESGVTQEELGALAGALAKEITKGKPKKERNVKKKKEENMDEGQELDTPTLQDLNVYRGKKLKSVPFSDLVWDETGQLGQCRPLKATLWQKYKRDLLQSGLPRQPVQALGWDDGSMPAQFQNMLCIFHSSIFHRRQICAAWNAAPGEGPVGDPKGPGESR